MIPLFKVFMSDNLSITDEVLRSGMLTQGPMVDRFEEQLRNTWQRKEVVTVNSCTSAIHLAFDLIKRFNSKVGRNFVVSPLTCAAGIFPGVANGFKPVWCDIGIDFNINLTKATDLLNSETQILTFVHWAGNPVNYDHLQNIKEWYEKKYRKVLYIIEDCAHGWNSTWNDEPISRIMPDNFKCYSFQAIKHLTTGDGGALLCGEQFYKMARNIRWFGLDRDNKQDFRSCQDIKEWGYKFHMNDIAASIGLQNLPYIDENVRIANDNANYYKYKLNGCQYIDFRANPATWLFTILVENREKFIEYMNRNSISVSPVHTRVDSNSSMQRYGSLSGFIDDVNNSMVSIPVGWWVSQEDREYIVDTINKFTV